MTVKIYLRIRLKDGQRRYAPIVYASNKKIKPLYALIDGQAQRHLEGVYHLRYVRDGKNVWEAVGPDAQVAAAAQIRRAHEISAQPIGLAVVSDDVTGHPLSEAVDEYLQEVRVAKAARTFMAYRLTLQGFLQIVGRNCTLESLDRISVLSFANNERRRGCSPRTVANRLTNLRVFFLHLGLQ